MNPILLPVLDVLAKSASALLLAWAVQSSWRSASAAQRCLVWLVAFAVVLLLPLTVLMKPVWTLQVPDHEPPPVLRELPMIESMPEIVSSAPVDSIPVAEPPWRMPQISMWQWLGLVWVTGAAALLLRRALGTLQLRRLHQGSCLCEDPRVSTMASRLASGLGVRRKVDLRFASRVAVPLTWGFFKPVLMMPAEAVEWTDARVDAALCHELGHIRHWDALTRLFMTVLCALQWPNALLWLAAKSWRTAQEQACDDLVLNSGASTQDYAMQLLESARSVQCSGFLHVAALTMAQPSTLETRLSAIMDPARDRRPLRRGAVLAGMAAAFSMLLLCAVWQVRAESKPEAAEVHLLPVQLVMQVKAIEIEKDARLDTEVAQVARSGQPRVLGDEAFGRLVRGLNQTAGVDLLSAPSITARSGQEATVSVGRDLALDPAGHETVFIGIKTELEGTITPEGIELKASTLVRDLNGPEGAKALVRERKGETEMTLRSGETLLLPAGPSSKDGQSSDTIFLITVRKAIGQGNVSLTCDDLQFNDAAHQTGKGTGHVIVKVTSDGKPPTVWDGQADAVEFDLAKRQVILRSHPVVTRDSQRHVGIGDDTEMIIDWNEPAGKLLTHGPAKVEIREGFPEAAEKPLATPASANVMRAEEQALIVANTKKMEHIIFPAVRFKDASLEEAVEFLRIKSKDLDTTEPDASRRGIVIMVMPGTAPSTARITLDLHDVPLAEALHYVTELAGMKYKVEPYGVIVGDEKRLAALGAPSHLASQVQNPGFPAGYFTVFGQVQRQGKYGIDANEEVRISRAISHAGGGTEFAVLSKVHVVRKNDEGRNVTIDVNVEDVMKNGNVDKDIFIRPYDVIIVDDGHSIRNFADHDSATPDNSEPVRPYHGEPSDPNAAIKITADMEKLDDTTRMRAGDLLKFRIVEDHDRGQILRVQNSGDLLTPHLGLVNAAGLTCKKVAYEIKRQLEKKGYAKATVILGIQYRGAPNADQASQPITPLLNVASGPTAPNSLTFTNVAEAPQKSAAQAKADKIVIPIVSFHDATVDECVEFLRVKARELDPAKEGVNIVLKAGPDARARSAHITMDLKNVPLSEVLRYVAGLADLELKADDHAMILQEPEKGKPEAALENRKSGADAAPAKASFTVLGLVQRQGKYELAPDEKLTLSQALLRVGGMMGTGRGDKVHVVRKTPEDKKKTIDVNVDDLRKGGKADQDILIEPDDVIIAGPERAFDF